MDLANWVKQAPDKPLYPNLLWSRPENRQLAGKLLIIGGNPHSFRAPAATFGYAEKAGVGVARVVLPASLAKTVGQSAAETTFAPSNPSGGFAKAAIADFMELSSWADLTLIAGDLGNNSETDILLESFVDKYQGLLCLTGDSLNSFMPNATNLFNRLNTALFLDFAQLQKLVASLKSPSKFVSSMNLLNIIDELNNLTVQYPVCLTVIHENLLLVSYDGKTSTTPISHSDHLQAIASYGSVWWLQNINNIFEAFTTAAYELASNKS